jgi:CRISPR-associated protein Cmx8
MAKAKAPKKTEPDSIEVRFDLRELPTAQHKAGLAGLLLQIDSMAERRAAGLVPPETRVPEIVHRSAMAALIRLTSRSVQDLLDDVYAAEVVEVRSSKRWPGSSPRREELNPSPGPGESRRWFFYDVIQPSGPFLRRYTDDGKEAWHKL